MSKHIRWMLPLLAFLMLAACTPQITAPQADEGATVEEIEAVPGEPPAEDDQPLATEAVEIAVTAQAELDEDDGQGRGGNHGEGRDNDENYNEIDEDRGNPVCDPASEAEQPQIAQIAEDYEAAVEDIAAWFCEGYGLGEIKLAYDLAAEADITVDEVIALRESGLGWGGVEAELGLSNVPAGNDDEPGQNPVCDPASEAEQPQIAQIAEDYEAAVEDIAAWFCEGYGLGEIKLAYDLAAEADITVDEVFALRESGLGWGNIKAELGISNNPNANDDETGSEGNNGNRDNSGNNNDDDTDDD